MVFCNECAATAPRDVWNVRAIGVIEPVAEKVTVKARPIAWRADKHGYIDEPHYGFWITPKRDDADPDEKAFHAGWGEGDCDDFDTLAEAQEWCQGLANDHVAKVAAIELVATPQQECDELHPATRDLVNRFSASLADKLLGAQRKYGYSDGWLQADWMDECRAKLVEHVAKGDPRDVAGYCAFLWHHGQSTAPQPPAIPAGTSEPVAAAIAEMLRHAADLRADGAYSCCAGTYEHCAGLLTPPVTSVIELRKAHEPGFASAIQWHSAAAPKADAPTQQAALCDGTRFKVSFDTKGRVSCFAGWEHELAGKWVLIVNAAP